MRDKVKGGFVAEMDAHEYSRIAGEFRNSLPKHIFVYVERIRGGDGRKIARLSSRYPKAARRVLDNVLGVRQEEPKQEIPKKMSWSRYPNTPQSVVRRR